MKEDKELKKLKKLLAKRDLFFGFTADIECDHIVGASVFASLEGVYGEFLLLTLAELMRQDEKIRKLIVKANIYYIEKELDE
jgi:hypothetical protein